ncbi:sulfotransferase [Prochlorococcus marinus XMU1414]|uniref:Sulfotransferase n=1 Tax=Prochlorococcus marinus XMU1424 TaxID=2774497 RepID=A0A9D9BXN3_PROMR|nr:sulfotransferase [Prochlorococcus marinus]MBO8228674.1 sulfotransferase [Prochlorococcus marinus XMU1414]MBW3046153.1 hypothetical protein [Prochlorococcus marinus str. MU1414]MCR8531555.1 sulfotransferase [Prochlorococcus marinus XMU1420]MCR8535284.1 sulfotransferase [Prochlorococcus marinus XMU1424]
MKSKNSFNRKKIIYIGGYGRSGSTILALILGQHPLILNLGEVGVLYAALKDNRKCTCGESFFNCSFWSELINSNDLIDGELKNRLLDPNLNVSEVLNYVDSVSDINCYVDATKTAWRNLLRPLKLFLSGYDVRLIHLLRKQSEVIKSAKKGKNTDLEFNIPFNDKFVVPKTIISYQISNIITRIYALLFKKKYLLINYEDFLENPINCLKKLQKFVNIDLDCLKLYLDGKHELATGHQINGNRLLRSKKIYFKTCN